jgi:hypothetical protein
MTIHPKTQQVLVRCRAKALGAPAPDLIAVRDPYFHAELLAESAVRLVRFRMAQAQQRAMSQVVLPRQQLALPKVIAGRPKKRRRK